MDHPLFPFVSSEVETPGRRARAMGISTSLDANGEGRSHQCVSAMAFTP